jgi:NAD(P)H-dependent nitrite reductase small subunit
MIESKLWHAVASIGDVAEDEPAAVEVEGKKFGIYQIDDEYYAIDDICPHAYALLSQGFVDEGEVECPLHNAVFNIKTGKCIKEPGGDINTYEVKVIDGQINIKINLTE